MGTQHSVANGGFRALEFKISMADPHAMNWTRATKNTIVLSQNIVFTLFIFYSKPIELEIGDFDNRSKRFGLSQIQGKF
jgi:hypothetical protein